MKRWYAVGSTAFGLLLGLGDGFGNVQAQQANRVDLPPLPQTSQTQQTQSKSALKSKKVADNYRKVAFQDVPAPTPPPVPSLPAPTAPEPSPPDLSAAPAPPAVDTTAPGFTESTASNNDLSLPKSEREGGGGEPTEATAAEEAAAEPDDKDPTKLLMNALGIEESKTKIYGWIQNSYTGNTNGVSPSRSNFGVAPNNLANRWQANQYYIVLEKPLEQNDKVNFGYRVDNLFGHDWQFNYMQGLLNGVFKNNHLGWDPAQFYAEIHLPWLTKGGIDVKGGRFYTILGYEVVPATGRPLLSVPYMFNYGQPFTHFGFLSTFHVTDRINWYNGAVNGWDRWVNENYKWNYLGGFTWTSENGKAAFAMSYIIGPDSYPRFLPNGQNIYPTGYSTNVPAGRRNPGYAGSDRISFTSVFTYKWTENFTQVMETDESIEKNVPGIGPGGTTQDAEWYSFGNWFLWQFYKPEGRGDVMTGVFRSEVFRDDSGVRTGVADNLYEMTLGLIYKPVPYIWVRPEARYDWCQFNKPYNDGTRGSQFTVAFDVILLF